MAYFCYGWPTLLLPNIRDKDSLGSSQTTILGAEIDELKTKLATFNEESVTFWSTGLHRLATGRICISTTQREECGPIRNVCFRFDGKKVAVVQERGLVSFYRLETFYAPEGRASWTDFVINGNNQESNSLKSYPSQIEYVLPVFEMQTRVCKNAEGKILGCSTCTAGVVIATNLKVLLCISWDSEVLWHTEIINLLSEEVKELIKQGEKEWGSIHIDYHRGTDLCGMVCGSVGFSMISFFRDGGRISPTLGDSLVLRNAHATCISLEPQQCIAAVGLSDGKVELYDTNVSISGQAFCMRTLSLDSFYIHPSETGAVACIQWSPDGDVIAVGYETDGITIWSSHGHRLFHTFSLQNENKSEDGHSDERSFQVQTKNGKAPNECTDAFFSSNVIDNNSQFFWFSNIKNLLWGPLGFSLFVVACRPLEAARSNIVISSLVELPLLKAGSVKGSCQSESTRRLLLGSSFFLLQQHSGGKSLDLPLWNGNKFQRVEVPYEYISENWPLKKISFNNDQTFVAVAGKHGFALYSTRLKKWRLFGDVNEEQNIRCCSLCWFGKSIIVGNEIMTQNRKLNRYELLIFSRDHLYMSSLQARIVLHGVPLLLDCREDGFLLVFASDLQLRLFELKQEGWSMKISTHQRWSFHLTVDVPLVSPRRRTIHRDSRIFVQSVRIYPRFANGNVPLHVLLLKSTGSLILLDIQQGISQVLLRNVHSFWYHTPSRISVQEGWELAFDVWAIAEDGIYTVFDSRSYKRVESNFRRLSNVETTVPEFVVSKWFQPDISVFPLGFTEYGDFLTGVYPLQKTDILVSSEGGKYVLPYFCITLEYQEFLSKILLHLIKQENVDDSQCLKFLQGCSEWPHFEECLERWLHEVLVQSVDGRENLEANLSSQRTTNKDNSHFNKSHSRLSHEASLLFRTLNLLRYFGEYEDVVVGCARKVDQRYWQDLFGAAGDPCSLFETCCLTERLTTGAAFLKIIQEWWDMEVAVNHGWRLLEFSLKTGCFTIIENLIEFLDRAANEGFLPINNLVMEEVEIPWLEKVVSGSKFKLSTKSLVVLLRYFRKFLVDLEWRKAVFFSGRFGFSLGCCWRELEKNSKRRSMTELLLSLHNAFKWPFPSCKIVLKKWDEIPESKSTYEEVMSKLQNWNNIIFGEGCDANVTSTHRNERYFQQVRCELQFLVGSAAMSSQWELALCGLTALLCCEELCVLLGSYPEKLSKFLSVLRETEVPGYLTLASKW
eukprot:jgi/Galph1/2445/GphlegSOOS_G1101.1